MRYEPGTKCLISQLVGAPLIVLLLITNAVWCQTTGMPTDTGRGFGWSLVRRAKARSTSPKVRQKLIPPSINEGDGVVRVDTDLVINDILVFNKKGQPVKGLTRQDFTVSEDKASQEIVMFSHADMAMPRSVILIIDHSGSQVPYIERSIEAAKVLVDKLNPNDQMAIVTDDIKLVAGPTSDKTFLKESLETLKATTMSGNLGKSAQYSSLLAVLNELADNSGARPVIIFQTDGDQTASLSPGRAYQGVDAVGIEKFSYDDIIDTAKAKGVTAYSVFSGVSLLGIPMREKLQRVQSALDQETRQVQSAQGIVPASSRSKTDHSFLKNMVRSRSRDELAVSRIAEFTGGLSQTLASPDQVSEVYERILSDMNRRYVIAYYPTNESRDGKLREIKIEVRGHPEYTIWGRKSYAQQ